MKEIMARMGIACVAALAFGMLAVATAVASSVEWLVNEVAVTTATSVKFEGEVELSDTKVLGSLASVLCGVIFDGTVSPKGAGEITEVLNLAGEKIGEKLTGVALLCKGVSTCSSTSEAEVWMNGLPWTTQAESIKAFNYWIKSGASPLEWEVTCTVLGTKITDSCQGITRSSLANVAEGVLSEFISEPRVDVCTQGGAGSGEWQGPVLARPIALGQLAIRLTPGPIKWVGGKQFFGSNMNKKQSTEETLEFTNETGPNKYETSTLSGTDYSLVAGTCTGNAELLINERCQEKIKFAPQSIGWFAAIIALSYQDVTPKQLYEAIAIVYGQGI
jgi:hypothetical protein